MRNFLRRLALFVLTIATIIIVVKLAAAWSAMTNEDLVCAAPLAEPQVPFKGYFEIQLLEQHPTEPTFESDFVIYATNFGDKRPNRVQVRRSEDRGYAAFVKTVDLRPVGQVDLGTRREKGLLLITETRDHRFFPFDTGTFDFDLKLTPELGISVVRIVNRVPGFVMDCSTLSSTRSDNGRIYVAFRLSRSPIIELMAIVLLVASLIFIVLTWWIESTQSLATSVASFFFAMWSIRAIFGSVTKTFPTLLDLGILFLSIGLLLSLFWKLLLRPPRVVRE